MKANYHTHTVWCKHGTGEIEDYLEEALRVGLKEIAITEHVPHKDNLDPKRLKWEEFHDFDQAFEKAINTYGKQIRIRKGFECEYYPEELKSYENFRDNYGYEILILGQHRSGKNREFDNFAPKNANQIHLYADEICSGLETGMFTFLAHPDLALHAYQSNQWDQECEVVMRQIFGCCEKNNIPVEINVNGLRGNMRYPDPHAYSLSKEYKLRYLINSDAHHPEHIYDDITKKAEDFATQLGIHVLDFLE